MAASYAGKASYVPHKAQGCAACTLPPTRLWCFDYSIVLSHKLDAPISVCTMIGSSDAKLGPYSGAAVQFEIVLLSNNSSTKIRANFRRRRVSVSSKARQSGPSSTIWDTRRSIQWWASLPKAAVVWRTFSGKRRLAAKPDQ